LGLLHQRVHAEDGIGGEETGVQRKGNVGVEGVVKREIKIQAGPVNAEAELNDTETAKAVWGALPFKTTASTWGEEIYFEIPVRHPLELGQEIVQAGDLGYWPVGRAFCIFFGPTPASKGDEIRPASPVTVIGHLRGNPQAFKHVHDGVRVVVTRREEPRDEV